MSVREVYQKTEPKMYNVPMVEVSDDFERCWQVAGLHLQKQAGKNIHWTRKDVIRISISKTQSRPRSNPILNFFGIYYIFGFLLNRMLGVMMVRMDMQT